MKKLVPNGHYSDNDEKANQRYIAHCNNIASIINSFVSAGNIYKTGVMEATIDKYFDITQASVVEIK